MDVPLGLRDVPSHFNWRLNEGSLKYFDAMKQQLIEHIEYNPTQMTVQACLFMSYLHVSSFKTPRKDTTNARKYLDDAYENISRLTEVNSPAWVGYMTVAKANEAIMTSAIKTVSEKSKKVQQLEAELGKLILMKTVQSEAYVDSIRAFALSRLGVSKYKEAQKYYQSAVDVDPENPQWLFGLGLITGRLARYSKGHWEYSNEMQTEKELYEKVMRLDSNHIIARCFLAQNVSIQGDTTTALQLCREAVSMQQSRINPSILRIIGKIFRRKGSYEYAIEIFQKVEHRQLQTSHLYHHWGLIYRDQYNDQKAERDQMLRRRKGRGRGSRDCDSRRPRGEEYSSRATYGAERSDKERGIHCDRYHSGLNVPLLDKNLLYKAVSYFDKSLECNETNTTALLDRARTYERLHEKEKAKADFEDLLSMPNVSGNDKVVAHHFYGLFLKRTYGDKNEAMEQFRSAIECALHCCNLNPYLVKGGSLPPIFNDRIKRQIDEDMEMFKEYNLSRVADSTISERCEGLRNVAWLANAVGDFSAAKSKYEECHKINEHDLDAIKGLAKCLIQLDDFCNAEHMIEILESRDASGAIDCKLESRLRQGQKALQEKKFQDARRLLLETLQFGSMEGCEDLLTAMQSCTGQERYKWEFRADCAKTLHCFNLKHSEDVNVVKKTSDQFSKLRLEEVNTEELTSYTERMKSLMELDHIVCGKLRLTHFRMEQTYLDYNKVGENKITLDASAEVLGEAHALLGRVMMSFKEKHYPAVKPSRCPYFYVRAGKVPKTEDDVRDDLLKRIDSKDKGNYQWKGFKEKFPDLLDFLVKIQPATDPKNNWYLAVSKLDNVAKHRSSLQYAIYDIPIIVEGTQGVDNVVPVGSPVFGGSGNVESSTTTDSGTVSRHPDVQYERFGVRDLARRAGTEVELIVSKFYEYMGAPDS